MSGKSRAKSSTISGQRIPVILRLKAMEMQRYYLKIGKRKSLQDVYREMARRF